MGQPVVHFEVMGDDGDKLRSFYSDLFDWKINADNPMNYGIVDRDGNVNGDGIGIGGGIGGSPEYPSHVTSTSRSPTTRPRSRRRRASAGRG
jgi:predicted enzyme related to lactoylglutathione lyase